MRSIEDWLEKPYWVIDFLPEQVPADPPGQVFAVEEYYRQEPRSLEFARKKADVLLKLNCYTDLFVGEEQRKNPPPASVAEAVRTGRFFAFAGDALIVSEPDDLYMTVYAPDPRTLELLRILAAAEGLFVWQPPQDG